MDEEEEEKKIAKKKNREKNCEEHTSITHGKNIGIFLAKKMHAHMRERNGTK